MPGLYWMRWAPDNGNRPLPETQIRVYEIYDSIQGESTLAGTPCTIVRLAGCPLRCSYCDTPQALSFKGGSPLSIDDITARVRDSNHPLCLVTGGEPLAQKPCPVLLSSLADICPTVQLETSGAFDINTVDSRIHRILDIKTPGSGEHIRNMPENYKHLRQGDEIKFVIMDRDDYKWMLETIRLHDLTQSEAPILASPAWGEIAPADLAGWIIEDNPPVRLQLQYHKLIWGHEATGV